MSRDTIMIIDDEPAMTKLLSLELEAEGFRVLSAPDGKAGLALIEKNSPQLVLLDVMMPGIDGYEVLRLLKANPATHHLPVILLTAKSLEADVQKGLDLCVDDYISKPFHSRLLVKRIRQLIKNADGKNTGSWNQKKILIVEDEPEMRQLLTLEFETSGFQVFQASNGNDGFNLAMDIHPDLVISDVLMPGLDGNQLLKKLRTTDFGKDVPFIILTARGKMKDYFETVDVSDFIAKPFDAHALLEKAKTLLNQNKSETPAQSSSEDEFHFLNKKKILILENDASSLTELQSVFRDYGYSVKGVLTVAQCLEQAALFHPDLILSKYIFEGMNGPRLVALFRGMEQFKKTPILLYSNSLLGGERESALEAGATDFLSDVNGIRLLKKINQILKC